MQQRVCLYITGGSEPHHSCVETGCIVAASAQLLFNNVLELAYICLQ